MGRWRGGKTGVLALGVGVLFACGGGDDAASVDAGADAAAPDAAVDAGTPFVAADPPPGTYRWDLRLDNVTVHDIEIRAGRIAIAGTWSGSGRLGAQSLPSTPPKTELPQFPQIWGVVAVFDLDGTLLWHRYYDHEDDAPHDVAIEAGGHVQLVANGTARDIGAGSPVSGLYVACYDANGDYHWHNQLDDTSPISVYSGPQNQHASVATGANHEVYVSLRVFTDVDFGGGTRSPADFIVAYDAAGAYRWDVSLPEQAHAWSLDASGTALLVGGATQFKGVNLGGGAIPWDGGAFVMARAFADGAYSWDVAGGGTGDMAPDNTGGAGFRYLRLRRGSDGAVGLVGNWVGGPVDFGDGNPVQAYPAGDFDPLTGEIIRINEYRAGFALRLTGAGAFTGVDVYDAQYAGDIALTPTAGYYVVGYGDGPVDLGAGVERPFPASFVVSYGSDGTYRWDSWLGDAVALTPNGDVVLAGQPAAPTDFGGGERTKAILLRMTP